MTRDEILTRIRKRTADQLGQPGDALHDEARLVDDLGADSLDRVELAIDLEDEFSIDITDEEIEATQTFGQLVALVTERVGVPA